MKVSFVYPKINDCFNSSHISLVRKNIGFVPPLSLTYLAATLRDAGHKVQIIDGNVLNLNTQEIIQMIKQFNTEIIGFNLSTFTFHKTLKIIKEIKKEVNIPVVVGGKHLEYFPQETINRNEIDYALIGESDYSIVELINAIENGLNLKELKGILFKVKNKVIITKPQDQDFDLDNLPFPAYDLLPITKYYTFLTRRRNFATMITSRGCPFKCIYCGVRNTKTRFSSVDKIISNIYSLKKLNVKEIEFYDNSFTLDKKRTIEFCKRMIKENLNVEFGIHTRVDLLDKSIIHSLSNAGCIRINLGVESANEKILHRLNKFISLDKLKKCVKDIKLNNMLAFGYFIMGSPGETFKTMQRNLDFARSLPFDYVQFTRMVAPPGTPLYDIVVKQNKKDFWKEYVQKDIEHEIPLCSTNLTNKEVNKFIEKSYKEFYFRPTQIYRVIKNIKSINQLKRYLKVGIESLH